MAVFMFRRGIVEKEDARLRGRREKKVHRRKLWWVECTMPRLSCPSLCKNACLHRGMPAHVVHAAAANRRTCSVAVMLSCHACFTRHTQPLNLWAGKCAHAIDLRTSHPPPPPVSSRLSRPTTACPVLQVHASPQVTEGRVWESTVLPACPVFFLRDGKGRSLRAGSKARVAAVACLPYSSIPRYRSRMR